MIELGDTVRIKSWKRLVKEFGFNGTTIPCLGGFVEQMKPYCGMEGKVVHIHESVIILDNPVVSRSGYIFTPDMVYKVTRKPQVIKEGDKVRFKSWEAMEDEFGLTGRNTIDCQFHFTEPMARLCGREGRVLGIDSRGCVLLDIAESHVWRISLDMLYKVK